MLLASELQKWVSIKAGKLNIRFDSVDPETALKELENESLFLKENSHKESEIKNLICLLSSLLSHQKGEESKESHQISSQKFKELQSELKIMKENFEQEQSMRSNLQIRLEKRNIPYAAITSEFFGQEKNLEQEHDC